jgi:uncharacterized membrane protein required for colicin V production
MGTDFFWFYDVILAAILIGMLFVGVKRGFVRMVLNLAAFVASFVVALLISDGVSTWVYDSFISKPLEQSISTSINDALGDNVVTQLGKIDMDKAKINGKSPDSLELKADKAGKVTVNLTNVNLSNTGISKVDLTAFGVDKSVDYSNINLGSVQLYESDIDKYGLEDMLLTEVLSQNIKNSDVAESVNDIIAQVSEAVPALGLDGKTIDDIDGGLVNSVVVSVVESSGNPGKAILDNVAKPVILVPLRTVVFVILFFLALIILSIIIRATSVVNKLPVIGKLNSLLGGVLGLVQGLIIVFIVVIIAHMAVALSNNTLIFLNEMTINKSYAFSWVYNFSFLDFLN